jgi:DNA-binding transcriptional MerR regulator
MKLQTKDVGKLLNLSADMIRKMENTGVIRAERTASGNRLFDKAEVERVKKEREKKGR